MSPVPSLSPDLSLDVRVATCGAAPLPALGLRQAYDEVAPLFDAVPEAELSVMNVDVRSAVETVMKSLPRLRELRPRMVDELPRFDVARFDRLGKLAAAASHAHTQWAAASAPTESIPALSEAVIAERDLLLSDASALARRGLLDGARVSSFRSPSGYRNAAYDLLGLVRTLRDHLHALAGKTAITPSELDRAEALGESLLAALIAKEQQLAAPPTEAASTRQRAFTLLDAAYADARRATAYLRWTEDDADTLAPSLRANRRRRRAPQSTPTDAAPLTPTANPDLA